MNRQDFFPVSAAAVLPASFNQIRAMVVALSVVLATPLVVAQKKLDGTWDAALVANGQRCAVELVMHAGQQYGELVRCGNLMIRQSGTYNLGRNGSLIRNVVDWDPKQRYVMDNGYSGHYETNAKPPGGSYQVTFTSANTMVWKDVNFGGTITFRRR